MAFLRGKIKGESVFILCGCFHPPCLRVSRGEIVDRVYFEYRGDYLVGVSAGRHTLRSRQVTNMAGKNVCFSVEPHFWIFSSDRRVCMVGVLTCPLNSFFFLSHLLVWWVMRGWFKRQLCLM